MKLLGKLKNFFLTEDYQQPVEQVDSSSPLTHTLFSWDQYDRFTIADACEGIQIFGGIGSGKSSGSGALIAKSYLKYGFGGLVLTAKPDETDSWLEYAEVCGRIDDVIRVSPESGECFNFIKYEYEREGRGGRDTGNLVELLLIAVEASQKMSGGKEDPFWKLELKKLLRNAFDLLALSSSEVSLTQVTKVIRSAPHSVDDLPDQKWADASKCGQLLQDIQLKHNLGSLEPDQIIDFEVTFSYWASEFPKMAEKTRQTVISMFTGVADLFLRNPMFQMFCDKSTFSPMDVEDGKIIILDLPVKDFNETAVIVQKLFKYVWQRAIERRRIDKKSRPVFLWADESQYFINEYDATFQTTARSSMACTVLLSQSISNYYAVLGAGDDKKAFVDSLLGNLSTKVFHSNNDTKTNQWASELFASDWMDIDGMTISPGQEGQGPQVSHNYTKQFHQTVPPREFTNLAKGGAAYGMTVEGIIHRSGRIFTGPNSNALKTRFKQSP